MKIGCTKHFEGLLIQIAIQKRNGPMLLIHLHGVQGALGFGEREHRPFQWPRVSLVPRGTLQIQIQFGLILPLKQTNKETNKS